jgi:hypothetical protein
MSEWIWMRIFITWVSDLLRWVWGVDLSGGSLNFEIWLKNGAVCCFLENLSEISKIENEVGLVYLGEHITVFPKYSARMTK